MRQSGPPMDFERKLRIQFGKALRKGFITNATLDPPLNGDLAKSLEKGERPAVVVKSKSGCQYWFTDRRTLLQRSDDIAELFRYENVRHVHWMFKDNLRRMAESGEEFGHLKLQHFDRVVVEAESDEVVLDGLDQSYQAIVNFLWWIIR